MNDLHTQYYCTSKKDHKFVTLTANTELTDKESLNEAEKCLRTKIVVELALFYFKIFSSLIDLELFPPQNDCQILQGCLPSVAVPS